MPTVVTTTPTRPTPQDKSSYRIKVVIDGGTISREVFARDLFVDDQPHAGASNVFSRLVSVHGLDSQDDALLFLIDYGLIPEDLTIRITLEDNS